jgi:cytochrome b subunit of formate dehydrogenase
MNNDKKLTIKRLVIFLVISFIPFIIIIPILWNIYGEPIYTSKKENVAVVAYILGVFGMMIPSAAHLITRLVTKEGFDNTYLGFISRAKRAIGLLQYWLNWQRDGQDFSCFGCYS